MLSGDDGLTVPMISIGGQGIVSVAGNIVPKAIRELSDHARQARMPEAAALNHKLAPVVEACFIESNPVPAKTALSLMGKCKPHARLPLAPINEKSLAIIRKALIDFGALNS